MKNLLRIMTAATTLTIAATTLPAAARAPQEHRDVSQNDQFHNDRNNNQGDRSDRPDYSNNFYYKVGNKEGYQDHGRNIQRKQHSHKYTSDEDRKAHDYGYQQGWSGTRYHSNPHH